VRQLPCAALAFESLRIWLEGTAANVAVMALAPIPLGWLAGFILLSFVRIQIAGIHVVVPWPILVWPQKAFVVFCALTSLGDVVLGLTAVFDLYVDVQVPVGLARSTGTVTKVGDFVTAAGTWTRSGRAEGSSMGYPLQTSRIECDKEERRCTKARAYVSGRVLFSDLVTYDVESWTAGAIVFRLDAPCAAEYSLSI